MLRTIVLNDALPANYAQMKTLHLNLEMNERHEFPSVARCIYCGSVDGKLTDEHVVPRSLTGHGVIFRKASCELCAQLFNREFEQHVLKKMWGPFRERIQAPSKSRKLGKPEETRDIHFKLLDVVEGELVQVGEHYTRAVPISKLPLAFPSWRLPTPGIIEGRPSSDKVEGTKWVRTSEIEFTPYIEAVRSETGHAGPIAIHVADVDHAKLFRFLAKTAHAYAVGVLGFEGFRHFLPDLLFGRARNFCHLIGGYLQVPEPFESANCFECAYGTFPGIERSLVVVKIHAFPMYGTPIHLVVVGDRPSTSEEAVRAKATPDGSWGKPSNV